MLARVAENLYWMGRYLERAENTARFINSTTQVLLDLPKDAAFGWSVLLKVAGLDEIFSQSHPVADEDSIVGFLIEDETNPSSILSSIRHARENARTVRDVLPMELWERINVLYLYARDHAASARAGRGPRNETLRAVIERCESVMGLIASTMSRDDAHQIIALGRNLERADMTSRILDANTAVSLPDDPFFSAMMIERLWMTTLNALSAYQMYRRHVGVHVDGDAAILFLLKDPQFPRSVLHCLAEIEEGLSRLPNSGEVMRRLRQAWRIIGAMRPPATDTAALHEEMDAVQYALASIHEAISAQYFHRHIAIGQDVGEAVQ